MASPFLMRTPIAAYSYVHITAPPTSVNTTTSGAITAGTQTVTPASMTGIAVGSSLHIAAGGGTAEDVVVTAATGTTFTAVFAYSHNASTAITSSLWSLVVPVGRCVSTVSATAITAGAGVVVTPASMANITSGMTLDIAGGVGTNERVLVTATTSTTFTATCTSNHSGGYVISSLRGSYLGPLVVGAAGTTVVLTLYDGHPYASTAGTVISIPALGTTPLPYGLIAQHGLYYTLTAASNPDLTLHYLDGVQP